MTIFENDRSTDEERVNMRICKIKPQFCIVLEDRSLSPIKLPSYNIKIFIVEGDARCTKIVSLTIMSMSKIEVFSIHCLILYVF